MKWNPISGGTTGTLIQPPLAYRNRGTEKPYTYLWLGLNASPPDPSQFYWHQLHLLLWVSLPVGGSVALFLFGGRCCIVPAFCRLHLESCFCLETGNRLLSRVSLLADGRGDLHVMP